MTERKTATGRPLEDFSCPRQDCPSYAKRGAGNLRFNGWSGHSRTYRTLLCVTCGHSFSELKGTVYEATRLGLDRARSVLEHIQEGCGTRKTSRLVKVSQDTVTRFIRKAGEHAKEAHAQLVPLSPP